MASLSSSDLEAIKPPQEPPPQQPDAKTETEKRTAERPKPPTATEREAELKQILLSKLDDHVDFHKGECERLRKQHESDCGAFKTEIDELQEEMGRLRDRIEELVEERTELRTAAKATGCLTLLANGLIAVGSGMVGVAGTVPNLHDDLKQIMGYGGSAVVICGLLVSVASYRLTPSSRKRESRVKSGPATPKADKP